MNRWRRRDVRICGVIVRRASHPPSRARCRNGARATPRARSPVTIETPERVTPGAVTPTTSVADARDGNLGTVGLANSGTSATRTRPRDDGDAADDELQWLAMVEKCLREARDAFVESETYALCAAGLLKREATRVAGARRVGYLDARDSEEELCSRAEAKRNDVCPFEHRVDDTDDDDDEDDDDDDGDVDDEDGGDVYDDRGRPRDEMGNVLVTGHDDGCEDGCQELIGGDSYGETYGAMMNEEDEDDDDERGSDAAVRRRDATTEQVDDAGRHVREVVGVQGLGK